MTLQASRDRLSNIRVVDPVLTELARGYYNGTCVGEKLMPVVLVDKEAAELPKFGREAFKVRNTKRLVRGNSNRIDPGNIGKDKYVIDENDLEYPIDYREENEAAYDLPAYATNIVKDGLDLSREKEIADLVCDEANYSADNKVVLSGTSQWSHPDADIPADVDEAKRRIKRITGREPNVMVIASNVWPHVKKHPSILEKLAHDTLKKVTLKMLQEILEVDEIVIGDAVYEDDNGDLLDLWKNDAVLAYVPSQRGNFKRNIYEPAYGYTLRLRDSLKVDRYKENGGKVELVRATDISGSFIVGADAGYLFKNAVGA